MYSTSTKWKQQIYSNKQCVMNVYFDNVLINPDYILDFKKGGDVFDEEFSLGSAPSQYIELQILKDQIPVMPEKIRVEYGILVNNVLTVEEVNAMLVGTLNGIPVKSLSANNSSFEIIPIGTYNLEDYTDNDNGTLTLKALDNMINFEFNYDGSTLVNTNGSATLLQVAQDICTQAGVELGSTSFLNSDKQIAVYDNTVTAREYIKYIAESSGGFACIGRDGKLYFRNIYQDTAEIPIELFGSYKWSEEFKITKVVYEDGTRNFSFGDDTRNVLHISQENMFIVDQEQMQRIYNKIKDLTINSFEGQTIIDPAIDIGDKIIVDGKPIIFQGEMSLAGSFIADIKCKIQIKQKEETTVKKESQTVINRKVQSQIDQANGSITLLAQEQNETSTDLATLTVNVNGISSAVSQKVGNDEVISKINQSAEAVQINANKISLVGKQINLTGDNTTITSNNFSVDANGNMSCSNANITGGEINLSSTEAMPKIKIINPNDASSYGELFATGLKFYRGNQLNLVLSSLVPSLSLSNNEFGHITLFPGALIISDENHNELITMNTSDNNGNITCVSLTQTSRAESKKNFEKLENALNIIKATDIYKYNLKGQKDGEKKHIGFVIGEDFKYSKEITSEKNDGVDTYSMVSVLWRAVQEQQEIIEDLKSRIEKLEKEVNK